jgi:GT2 family glycosyltransferase
MHRSGSSVASRLLNMMGLYLGAEDSMMLPQSDNSVGFWERQDVADINDLVLSRYGASWDNVYPLVDSCRPPEENIDVSTEAGSIKEIIHRIDSHRPWCIKDPRIAITHDLWLPELSMPYLVYVYRNPLEIAQSLHRREGVKLDIGLAIWEFYTVSMLKASVGKPYTLLNFSDIMRDPQSVVDRLYDSFTAAGVTGIRKPSKTEIGSFIDPTKVTHQEDLDGLSDCQIKLANLLASGDYPADIVSSLEVSTSSVKLLKNYHTEVVDTNGYVKDHSVNYKDTFLRRLEREQAEVAESVKVLLRLRDEDVAEHNKSVNIVLDRISDLQEQSRSELKIILERNERMLENRLKRLLRRVYAKLLTIIAPITSFYTKLIGRVSKLGIFLRVARFVVKHPVTAVKMVSWYRIKTLARWMSRVPAGTVDEMLSLRMAVFEPRASSEKITYCIEPVDPKTIRFPLEDKPLISIVIPVFNQWSHTKNCLRSIMQNTEGHSYQVIVADDVSDDDTGEEIKLIENIVHLRNDINLKFVKNCNNAVEYADGEYVILLNNDTLVLPEWLDHLLVCFNDPAVGLVGPKLLFEDGKVQEAGGIIWNDASGWNFGRGKSANLPELNYLREVDYISGACIMFRRCDWDQIGGFDEIYVPAYYEDTDFAFEMRKIGKKVIYQPLSEVVHFEGVSHGSDLTSGLKAYQVTNQQKFREKWADILSDQHYANGIDVFRARERREYVGAILIVDHYVPFFDQDAGSRSTYQYIKLFISLGYKVLFLADNFYEHQPYTNVLRQQGVEVLTGSWFAQNWKKWIDDQSRYIDYIYLHRPHISEVYIDVINQLDYRPKVIYFGHDLHFIRVKRQAQLEGNDKLFKQAEDWRRREFEIFRKVDLILYPSEEEVKEILAVDSSLQARTIPLNIYPRVDEVKNSFGQRTNLMFVGGFGHPPNKDAVMWFVNEVMPIILNVMPMVTLNIIGSKADEEITSLESTNIKVMGRVSDDELVSTYRNSLLSVAPLRYGAGVKGKVLESLNYGVPVVTTSIGAEGLPLVPQSLAVADNALLFAEHIMRLCTNEKEWNRAVNAGHQLINSHFSKDAAIKALEPFFEK